MIRIEVEVETNDPALRDYVLGDIASWRRSPAKISVSTHEEDPWSGGTRTERHSASTSMTLVGVADETVDDDEPTEPERFPPPQHLSLEAARASVDFPVLTVSSMAAPTEHAIVQVGVSDLPTSVVVTHLVHDEHGRHRGNVWVTSSAERLPASQFDVWRTVDGFDVCEDRSGGYYRCKVRTQPAEASYVQLESTGHRLLEEVMGLLPELDAGDDGS